MSISDLNNMSLTELRKWALDKLGLDVAGIEDRTLIMQRVLAVDETVQGGRG